MSKLNRNPFSLKLKQGLAANINIDATKLQAVTGEPHYATDTKDLYIFDGTENKLIAGETALSQYALLAGRSGGQTLIGGTANNNVLTLQGNSGTGNTATNKAISLLVGNSGTTEAVTLLNNGNVGIGTTSPNSRLEMVDSGNARLTVRQSQPAAENRYAQLILTHGSTFFGANDKTYQVISNGLSTGEADFAIQYWNGSVYAERMRITNGGNVGINDTAPSAQLHVDQTSTTAAKPTLRLQQADLSEEFIRFDATVGAGNPIDTAALGTYYGKIRVHVEGVGAKFIALYNS